jgi:hypothetical protein
MGNPAKTHAKLPDGTHMGNPAKIHDSKLVKAHTNLSAIIHIVQ